MDHRQFRLALDLFYQHTGRHYFPASHQPVNFRSSLHEGAKAHGFQNRLHRIGIARPRPRNPAGRARQRPARRLVRLSFNRHHDRHQRDCIDSRGDLGVVSQRPNYRLASVQRPLFCRGKYVDVHGGLRADVQYRFAAALHANGHGLYCGTSRPRIDAWRIRHSGVHAYRGISAWAL